MPMITLAFPNFEKAPRKYHDLAVEVKQ